MKIIFLDIDGVMNTPGYIFNKENNYHNNPCDTPHVEVLNEIIAHTGALVVISSSWRLFWKRTQCADALSRKGFKGMVVGCTPISSAYGDRRGHEIQEYIDNLPSNLKRRFGDLTHFVILDDDSDMEHLMHKLVQTNGSKGLTRDHIPDIMNHLT